MVGVGFFYSRKRLSVRWNPAREASSGPGLSSFYISVPCLYSTYTSQSPRSFENPIVGCDGPTSTLGCSRASHFQGPGSLLLHAGGEGGDLLGKLPSFYCSKSLVKHLNLHLSKSLLERGLFFLQLLRIAEQKYHLPQ